MPRISLFGSSPVALDIQKGICYHHSDRARCVCSLSGCLHSGFLSASTVQVSYTEENTALQRSKTLCVYLPRISVLLTHWMAALHTSAEMAPGLPNTPPAIDPIFSRKAVPGSEDEVVRRGKCVAARPSSRKWGPRLAKHMKIIKDLKKHQSNCLDREVA